MNLEKGTREGNFSEKHKSERPVTMDARSCGEQVPKQTRRVNLGKASALGVLRCLTGLLQAVLLTLDRAGVTRQEACTLEGRTIIRGYLDDVRAR